MSTFPSDKPATSAAPSAQSLPRVLITIATYNERQALPHLLEQIFAHQPEADVLVIDDHSPDGTGEWCDEVAASDRRVRCLHRKGKLGLGTAVVAGMKRAIDDDYDLVINMDADLSHHPRYLAALIAAADTADVVIGSRYVPGGGTQNWPLRRRLMSRGVNLYARPLLGLPVRDCSSGFRCVRVDFLRRLDLNAIQSRGYAFFEEVLWRMKLAGARFCEVPFLFKEREEGYSKISWREVVVALAMIFRLGVKNWLGF